ncbi:ligase [Pseudomonas aeruginosa]|nr:ligase [Pseudomonas aeruginosa]
MSRSLSWVCGGRPGRPHIWVRVTPGKKGFTGGTGGAPRRLAAEKTNPGGGPASSQEHCPGELHR